MMSAAARVGRETPTPIMNLRDLGGLGVAGGVTRHGVLLRSAAPGRFSEPPSSVAGPPSLVVDLRSAGEVTSRPHWISEARVRRFDVDSEATPHRTEPWSPIPWASRYRSILEGLKGYMPLLLRELARERPGPTLVHCAAGKDRTGVAVALLLLAAGVTRATVLEDFEASTDAMPEFARRWSARSGVSAEELALSPALEVSTQAFDEGLEEVWEQSASRWLISHGVDVADLDAWRRRLVVLDSPTD